jgi:hypothetical protein
MLSITNHKQTTNVYSDVYKQELFTNERAIDLGNDKTGCKDGVCQVNWKPSRPISSEHTGRDVRVRSIT